MKLHNDYYLLSKEERLVLYLDAVSRNDRTQIDAVIKASPLIEVKVVDFSSDLNALMYATLMHYLGQTNLFIAILELWRAQEDPKAYLAARLYATHYVVREEAWRSICKERGFDCEKLISIWGDFMYVNTANFEDEIKKLVITKTEYKLSDKVIATIQVPNVEDVKKEHLEMIATFQECLG